MNTAPSHLQDVDVTAILEDFKKIKSTIREQETRIRALEAKIAKLEKEAEDKACSSGGDAELV